MGTLRLAPEIHQAILAIPATVHLDARTVRQKIHGLFARGHL